MSAPVEFIAQVEDVVDYEETARLANEAFPGRNFTPEHLRWLYQQCFSQGATVVSLRANGRKVGQFVMLRQTVRAHLRAEAAVQLIDLFVLKPYRSREALAKLYGEVARQCALQQIRFAIGMPNERAIRANEFFMGLKPHLSLDIHVGFAIPRILSTGLLLAERFVPDRVTHYNDLFERFEPMPGDNGVAWKAAGLCERLNGAAHIYGLHMVENLLLISSPRIYRRVRYTLYCGFFVRRNTTATRRDIRAVTRSAATLWRQPLFVYPGVNRSLSEVPGWRLPNIFRPSVMLIQLRDFHEQKRPLQWDRYQAIDFDFA